MVSGPERDGEVAGHAGCVIFGGLRGQIEYDNPSFELVDPDIQRMFGDVAASDGNEAVA